MGLILIVVGFVLGALSIVGLEIVALLYIINKLSSSSSSSKNNNLNQQQQPQLDPRQSLDFPLHKQGVIWVLESDIKVAAAAKNHTTTTYNVNSNNNKNNKEIVVEVFPVRKLAKLRDSSLILTGSDASRSIISLKGSSIHAVSATNLPSRKWAKRFPIKLENKTSPLYNGHSILYIYLDTSWEKESWCKALRLAASSHNHKLRWVAKLNQDFHIYVSSLNSGYPSFLKPSPPGFTAEPFLDKSNRFDASSSKVRMLWKKLARKASKPPLDNTSTSFPHEDRKPNLLKTASVTKPQDNMATPSTASVPTSATQNHIPVPSDADVIDEGSLCWNLLISRLFFDAKGSSEMRNSIQARIQRTLSNMRTPSYIGEILCSSIDLGNLPPYIHGMRVLPAEMNEVWALEADVEYSGGFLIDIETRLEVRELGLQKDVVDEDSQPSPVGEVSSDLLEGIEYFGKQLNMGKGDSDGKEQKIETDSRPDGLKSCKSAISAPASVSRWKSIVNTIAKQVSQVPLSLSIRVASLRGTLRLHIKPPPSDQLWFGFTSMPDIQFELQSSVGDHKISSSHTALFLVNRFKTSIRESMVLPNCENVCIPWMLADKDDWVPRKVAPFIWLNQETVNSYTDGGETSSSQTGESKTEMESSKLASNEHQGSKPQNQRNLECDNQQTESTMTSSSASSCTDSATQSSESLQELRMPLLASGEPQGSSQPDRDELQECHSPSRSLVLLDKQNSGIEDDESRPKRVGRRAKMLDLGKKMGEKLEEKRRHLEEKSRHIVEKMRGP